MNMYKGRTCARYNASAVNGDAAESSTIPILAGARHVDVARSGHLSHLVWRSASQVSPHQLPMTLIIGQLSTMPVILSVTVPALARSLIWSSLPRATALAGSFQVTITSCHSGV